MSVRKLDEVYEGIGLEQKGELITGGGPIGCERAKCRKRSKCLALTSEGWPNFVLTMSKSTHLRLKYPACPSVYVSDCPLVRVYVTVYNVYMPN